jgi:quinol monooxygenase YgiN
MLVRIVRMTFAPDAVDSFLDRFDDAAPRIRAFPGCRRLELWRDADASAVFATHSHWTSAEALEAYRESDLFRSTWATVKPLFADRPRAHSYTVARPVDTIADAAGRAPDAENQ